MRALMLLAFIPAFAAAARAQGSVPPATAHVAASAAACARLMAGAGYVPGLDSGGNAVAPADLSAAPASPATAAADMVAIEIDPRIAGQYGLPVAGSGTYRTRATLGSVTVANGQVLLNGKSLTPEATDALAAACRAARK